MKRPTPVAALTAVLMAVPLAELGHALAYYLHYGGGALVRQTIGAHTLFPTLVGTAFIVVGGLLLGSLLLIGLARHLVVLRGPEQERISWPILPLTVALLGLQMAVFVGQEALEGASLALGPGGIGAVLVFGALGQTPVALAAGVALGWFSTRVVRAVVALRKRSHLVLAPVPARPIGSFERSRPLPRSPEINLLHPRRGPPSFS